MRRLFTLRLVAPAVGVADGTAPAANGNRTSVPSVQAGGRNDAGERPDLLAERLWSLQSELTEKTRKVRELYVMLGVLAFVIAPLAVYLAEPEGIAWVWWPAALGVALLGVALPITVPVQLVAGAAASGRGEARARELDAWLLDRGYGSTRVRMTIRRRACRRSPSGSCRDWKPSPPEAPPASGTQADSRGSLIDRLHVLRLDGVSQAGGDLRAHPHDPTPPVPPRLGRQLAPLRLLVAKDLLDLLDIPRECLFRLAVVSGVCQVRLFQPAEVPHGVGVELRVAVERKQGSVGRQRGRESRQDRRQDSHHHLAPELDAHQDTHRRRRTEQDGGCDEEWAVPARTAPGGCRRPEADPADARPGTGRGFCRQSRELTPAPCPDSIARSRHGAGRGARRRRIPRSPRNGRGRGSIRL